MKSSLFFLVSAALITSALSFSVAAQTAPAAAPTPEQMIEQLRAPRTRSLRNLTVEQAPAAAASAAQPASAAVPATPATAATAASPAPTPAVQPAPEPRPSLSLLIQFDFDSARVRPVSQQALANLAAALQSKELQDSKFAIEGHTDAKGRADYNLRLSQQRADAVRDVLASQGVKLDRLKAQGKGSSELANPSSPEAAENRRVRIVNLD